MSSVREDMADLFRDFRMGKYNTENLNSDEVDLWKIDTILSLKYDNGQPKLAILSEDQSRPEYSYSWAKEHFKHSGDEYAKALEDMSDFKRIVVEE